MSFRIGDEVRVVGLLHSDWHAMTGVVVEIIELLSGLSGKILHGY